MTKKTNWWGISSIVGGTVWIVSWIVIALRPEAESGGYREVDDVHIWIMTGMAFILVGCLGMHWFGRRSKSLAEHLLGVPLLAGASLMAIGRWMQHQGWDPQPTVAIGWILLFLGLFSYGVNEIVKRTAPLSIGAAYLITACSLIVMNDQDWRAWLAVPFGAAWLLLGTVALRTSRSDNFD
ncbi:hypothetical protein ACFPVX_19060 [Cohnella faecalis]|uniref:Uncharacterized protein n=1 Tax=Cohnella faecalis TaxID=2315694 RepID=A0A398CGN2_9BACL|nr:hypothetical protein [Cohnella faecalis]RIE01112.1 hypothetical protein D3H35_22100 [Cohnella faecalis]